MNNLTNYLLDLVLIKNLTQFVQKQTKQVEARLKQVKPFSWEAALLMSLFSWFVYLLVQGFYAKKLISVFAWGFLILGTDWALLGKQIKIPLIGFKFQHGPWITGAIACIALLSNNFLLTDWRGTLISWPIISAFFAGYSKFIQYGLKWQLPNAVGRQDLVLLFLLSGLFSCWFQFHFMVQDILRLYPNLLADNFDRSAFVVRSNPARKPASKGYALLETAEATVRQELTGKTWLEAQRWLNQIDSVEADLSRKIIATTYQDRLPREQQFWQITAEPSFQQASVNLILRALWKGPSSRPEGYTLRRDCTVSQIAMPPPQTFEEMQRQEGLGSSYQLLCQPTKEERSDNL